MISRLLLTSITLVLVIFAITSTTVNASPMSLKSLKTGERNIIIPDNELATIAMVYQPDCSWCKKQEQLLRKIQHECGSDVNLALIGNKGTVRELKRELKHFNKAFPAYKADKKFLHEVGGIAASPTTLFFDKEGNILAKKRGYIPPEQLFNAVNIVTNKSCSIS